VGFAIERVHHTRIPRGVWGGLIAAEKVDGVMIRACKNRRMDGGCTKQTSNAI